MTLGDRILYFPHLPNVGGGVVNIILARHYNLTEEIHFPHSRASIARLRRLSSKDAKKLKCIRGHGVFYGLHKLVPQNYTYFSMLRDPVKRVISQYYYYKDNSSAALHQAIVTGKLSLAQFAKEQSNQQLRYFRGIPYHHTDTPTKEDLERAKQSIKSDFILIGTTELFDQSVFLLQDLLGWENYTLWHMEFKGKNKPKDFPAEVIQTIEESNQLDRELHSFATEVLQEQLALLSESKRKTLDLYKTRSQAFDKIYQQYSTKFDFYALHAIFELGLNSITVLQASSCELAQEYFELLTTCANQNQLTLKEIEFFNWAKLAQSQVEQLCRSDKIVLFAPPGEEAQFVEELTRQGIARENIVFALIPPAA